MRQVRRDRRHSVGTADGRNPNFPTGRSDRSVGRNPNRAAAVVGIVLVLGASAYLAVSEDASNSDSAPPGTAPAGARAVAGIDAQTPVGSCFDDDDTSHVIRLTDCATVHGRQLVANVVTEDASITYPSSEGWHDIIVTTCMPSVDAFTGYAAGALPSTLFITGLFPPEEAWNLGDRGIHCVVGYETPTTGSAKDLAKT